MLAGGGSIPSADIGEGGGLGSASDAPPGVGPQGVDDPMNIPLVSRAAEQSSRKGKSPAREGDDGGRKTKGGVRGMVWKQGYPEGNPDSCVMLLPGSSEVLGADENPPGFGRFSLEAFRALTPPFLKKKVKMHPERAADELSGYVLQAGAAMVYFGDYMRRQKGKMTLPEVDESELAKLELEKSAAEEEVKVLKGKLDKAESLKNGLLGKLRTARDDVRKLQLDLKNSRSSLGKFEEEKQELVAREAIASQALSDSVARNTALAQRVIELESSLDAANARGSFFEDKVKELEKELKDVPSRTVTKFLESAAFKTAAVLSCVGMLRSLIYDVLKDLSKAFPFRPESLGFGPVDKECNEHLQQTLPGFVWDMEDDQLFDANGLAVTEPETLQTLPDYPLVHFWSRDSWPEDIPLPEDDV